MPVHLYGGRVRFLRRRWVRITLVLGVLLFATLYTLWRGAIDRNRAVASEPLHIAGNLYYIGAAGMASFLLTGPEGHVLIDGGWPQSAPGIIASIERLGFKITDVKILLNTHAHSDHAGGLKEIQRVSGAELWVSEGDAEVMAAGGKGDPALGPLRFVGYYLLDLKFPAPRIDHRFKDGDTIRLGPLALTAHVTAGHTRGCTTWSFPVRHEGRELLAVDFCSLTLFPFVKLVGDEAYPGIRADFERSFTTLRAIPTDIFLAPHNEMFDLGRKRRAQATAADSVAPFIDREGYLAIIDRDERRFREALAKQQR
jgi:metallo-beta-lactamase class B